MSGLRRADTISLPGEAQVTETVVASLRSGGVEARWDAMTGAGRNIRVTDETESRDDIARLYGEEHGDVWDLLRRMGLAAEMRPPIFKVHALVARVGGHVFQSRGRAMVEQGWLTVFPKEDARLERQLSEDPSVLNELAQESSGHDIAAVDVVRDTRQWREQVLTPAALIALMKEKGIGRQGRRRGLAGPSLKWRTGLVGAARGA